MTCTTPTKEVAPYITGAEPFSTSMRSTCARLIDSNAASPSVAEPTRTPSISTSVLLVLAPRSKMPAA